MAEKKEVKKNHAQSYDAGQCQGYTSDPEALKIVTDRKHWLFQSRALRKPDPTIVQDMVENGWLKKNFVLVLIDPETKERLVTDGRQSVLAAREANRIRAEMDPPREPIECQYMLDPKGAQINAWERMQQANVRVAYNAVDIAEAIAGGRAGGYPDEKLADKLSTITGRKIQPRNFGRFLKVLDCSAATKKALIAGDISESQAIAVSQLTAEEQAAKLSEMGGAPAERTKRPGVTRAELRRLVDAFDASDRRLESAAPIVAAFRYMLGDADASEVPHLDALIRRVSEDDSNGPKCRHPGNACEGVGAARRKWLCKEHYEAAKS